MNWEHFANQAIDLMCTADATNHFVWLNTQWTEALGWSLDELKAKPYTAFLHPDDVENSRVEAQRLIESVGHQALAFTNRYVHRDGHYVWLEWNAAIGPDHLLYATARVVTQRVERERAVREQLALLDAIEAQAHIGRWRVDLKTNTFTWSSSVFLICGLDPSDEVPSVQSGIASYHPDDQAMVARAIRGATERGEPFAYTARLMRPDGVMRWVAVDGLVLYSDAHEPEVMHGLIRDITDEQTKAKQLIHIERLASIGEIATSVAHEINNPLQNVTVNLDVLKNEMVALDHPQLELLSDAREGTERVRKIVEALQRFSRESTQPFARFAPVELLLAALHEARPQLAIHAWIELELEDDLPDVEVEEESTTQALHDILLNATQALADTGGPGNLYIRVFSRTQGSNTHVVFEIEDEGVGLPLQDTSRLFEPFYTARASGSGTGLGLPLTRSTIKAQGGDFTLDDRETGRGAIARISLPAAKTSRPHAHSKRRRTVTPAPEPTPPSPPAGRSAGPILLIDDEATILRTLSRSLSQSGHDVSTACDEVEALAHLRARDDWALILCDLKMPTLTGMELREVVLTLFPSLEPRLYFMTGDQWSDEYRTFLTSLARPHLDKPFSLDDLTAFVDAHILEPVRP